MTLADIGKRTKNQDPRPNDRQLALIVRSGGQDPNKFQIGKNYKQVVSLKQILVFLIVVLNCFFLFFLFSLLYLDLGSWILDLTKRIL